MGVAAYVFLFASFAGCIAFGLINWSKESVASSASVEDKEKDRTAV